MGRVSIILAMSVLILFCVNPAAAAPPDVTGTWSGTAYLSYDTFYDLTTITLEITHQNGNRFRGTSTSTPPYGSGIPSPLNGIISGDELHITSGRSVTAFGKLNSTTTPTRIDGYFHHLEEEGKPAHTGRFSLRPPP